MDSVIVVSNHSKNIFENTNYEGVNSETNEPMTLTLTTPVEAVNYPVKKFDELPDFYSFIGILLIVLSGIYIVFRENRKKSLVVSNTTLRT